MINSTSPLIVRGVGILVFGWEGIPLLKFFRDLGILPPIFFHIWEFPPLENSHFKKFNHFYYHFCCKIEKFTLSDGRVTYTYILYLMILSLKQPAAWENFLGYFFHPKRFQFFGNFYFGAFDFLGISHTPEFPKIL